MIILKRAGRPGQFFSVKLTFLGSRSSKKKYYDKDNDQQDVSSLAFFAKHRLVNRLLKIRNLFLGSIFGRFANKRKKVIFLNCLTRRRQISAAYLTNHKLIFPIFHFFLFLMPRPIFARQKWSAGGGHLGKAVKI